VEKRRVGAHLSIAQGLPKAVEMALKLGANTFQYFTRNPRGGAARSIEEEEIKEWKRARQEADIYPVVGHFPYAVNLGAAPGSKAEFARMVLREDTLRVAAIGGEYLVVHPGHHDGEVERAIERIVAAIKEAYLTLQGPVPMLLLETLAGQGREVGSLEEIRNILDGLGWPPRVGVCLDSAHLFEAGWDLRTREGCDRLVERLGELIGLDRIKIMHLNDSKTPLGSRKDRHANIGKGELGLEGIKTIVNHPFLGKLPLILETPVKEYEEYGPEIHLVRSLMEVG